MASFDFKNYLAIIDPVQTYEIVALAGGRVNFTVRATKADTAEIDSGRFVGRHSVVLKYAPPYIALSGKDAHFSQFRQVSVVQLEPAVGLTLVAANPGKTIESRALALFAEPDGELLPICQHWNIGIPQLLLYDPDSHIIVMEDLGNLDTLTEQLRHMMADDGPDETAMAHSDIGRRLGGFLADLHSSSTLEKMGPKRTAYFDNPGLKDVIHHNVIAQLQGRLLHFGIDDALELYRRVEKDHLRPDDSWERSFVLGDLWTGSILLEWPKICVIDWEFAGVGRGANEDMATFLAQLHLHLLACELGSKAHVSICALTRSTISSYRRQRYKISGEEMGEQSMNGESGARLRCNTAADLPIALLTAIRSAFIVHGRKMVNNAVERDWRCKCCVGKKVATNINKVLAMKDCKLFANLMNRGIWYLRTAASDLRAFSQDDNWKEVLKEEGPILELFFET
jgi:Phosphotransferase enzyme family